MNSWKHRLLQIHLFVMFVPFLEDFLELLILLTITRGWINQCTNKNPVEMIFVSIASSIVFFQPMVVDDT